MSPALDATGVLSELVRERPKLMRHAMRLCKGRKLDAEDLVQDTLVRCVAAADRYVAHAAVATWAIQIMRNSFINGVRHQAMRRRRWPVLAHGETYSRHPETIGRKLLDAVDSLTPAQRRIFAMRAEGYAVNEIADEIGANPSTVGVQLFRARQTLRALLDEDE